MTNYSAEYRFRNVVVAALRAAIAESISSEKVPPPDAGGLYQSRVLSTEWLYGTYINLGGLTKKDENAIFATIEAVFPKFRIEVVRKSHGHPRAFRVSFN
jgi:hypothetical protein